MFLLAIKLDRESFETKGRQNLQKTADFVIVWSSERFKIR